MSAHSPAFRSGLLAIAKGEILVPPLRAYLSNPDFKGMTLVVPPIKKRIPDRWFHPSTHPQWADRALWLNLVVPEMLLEEPRDHGDMLALTVGSIWHTILEDALEELGLLDGGKEIAFEDPPSMSRGKVDGVHGGEIIEIKTMKAERMRKLTSADDYLAANPTYHLQALEYMRISGLRRERVLLMSLTYPYEMREFVVEYDLGLAQQTADRFRRVVQDAADGRVPMCSGCKGFCPAKGICSSPNAQAILDQFRGGGQ